MTIRRSLKVRFWSRVDKNGPIPPLRFFLPGRSRGEGPVRLLVFTVIGVVILGIFRVSPTPTHACMFYAGLITAMALTEARSR